MLPGKAAYIVQQLVPGDFGEWIFNSIHVTRQPDGEDTPNGLVDSLSGDIFRELPVVFDSVKERATSLGPGQPRLADVAWQKVSTDREVRRYPPIPSVSAILDSYLLSRKSR